MQDRTEVREIVLSAEDCEAILHGEVVTHTWPNAQTSGIIHKEESDRLQSEDMPSDFMVEISKSEFSELGYGKVMISEGKSGNIYYVRLESTPEPEAEQVAHKWEQNPNDYDYAMVRFEQL